MPRKPVAGYLSVSTAGGPHWPEIWLRPHLDSALLAANADRKFRGASLGQRPARREEFAKHIPGPFAYIGRRPEDALVSEL